MERFFRGPGAWNRPRADRPASPPRNDAMPKPLTIKQQAFLDAYRTYGIVRIAAAKSGVSRELHYNALRVSETYCQALAAIDKEHALQLEEQARTIILNQGVPEPVFY